MDADLIYGAVVVVVFISAGLLWAWFLERPGETSKQGDALVITLWSLIIGLCWPVSLPVLVVYFLTLKVLSR